MVLRADVFGGALTFLMVRHGNESEKKNNPEVAQY
jgi:hypothetical protein